MKSILVARIGIQETAHLLCQILLVIGVILFMMILSLKRVYNSPLLKGFFIEKIALTRASPSVFI